MKRTKQAWKRGSCRELGVPSHPRQVQLLLGVGACLFSRRSWIQSLFLGLGFLSGKVSMVSIDFGKYT